MPIENISDTARWVATYRAMESERPDAIFRDPYARRLAGAKGAEIVEQLPRGRQMAWPMIVRTALFDEIILERVRGGADTVMNLAAGLDARPWRMPLPRELRWFDVDLPGILDYKLETLAGETPVCRYEAIRADLTDAAVRRETFARVNAGARETLVATEGLLIYLTAEQAGALASDLHAQPTFRWWLIDLASPRLLEMMSKWWGKGVQAGNAPFQFAPADGTDFFRKLGWREVAYRSTWDEAQRLRRQMRGAWLWNLLGRLSSKKRQAEFKRFSGTVLLERI